MINLDKQGQPDRYLFVIDTDSYAGNFQREMCAYVTGKIGDCGVGRKEAELAKQEIPDVVAKLDDMLELVPDEDGCARPVSLLPSPRYGNDGHGNCAVLTDANREQYSHPAYFSFAILFNSVPDSGLLEIMKERARCIAKRGVGYKNEKKAGIEGFRLLEQRTLYTKIDI